MLNIYMDMDGTLNLPDPTYFNFSANYRPVETPGTHYFRNLPVNKTAADFFQKLITDKSLQSFYNHFILSHIRAGNPEIANEHLYDKTCWLRERFSGLDAAHIIWCLEQMPKPKCVEITQNRKLTERDILIDDYGKNLIEWEAAGGTAVKFLNGWNEIGSWKGLVIHQGDTPEQIFDMLTKCQLEQNFQELDQQKEVVCS